MLVNVDGYISEIPDGTAYLTFHSGSDCAGTLVARDKDGKELELTHVAAEFNLHQKPWWERLP